MWCWIMPSSKPVLVFDIGGTKVACAVWTPDGEIAGRSEIDTQAEAGPEAVVARIVQLGHSVLARIALERTDLLRPTAAGIASAGQIDVATGTVSYATFHLPGWIGFPLGQRLSAGLKMPVTIDNDVNCHALAEARLGAGRPYRHFLLVAVGTGVGGGIVIDGQVYRGRCGGAGEIGQICVQPISGRPCSGDLTGCLEAYAASSVMVAESGYASVHTLAEAYRAGAAIPAVERAAAWLGKGLAIAVHVLAPEAVLIGGSAGLLGRRYLAAVHAGLEQHTLASHKALPLHFTQLGADSGLVGAGLLVNEPSR
jgi:glucokinase